LLKRTPEEPLALFVTGNAIKSGRIQSDRR
jgi:hypothetical protein